MDLPSFPDCFPDSLDDLYGVITSASNDSKSSCKEEFVRGIVEYVVCDGSLILIKVPCITFGSFFGISSVGIADNGLNLSGVMISTAAKQFCEGDVINKSAMRQHIPRAWKYDCWFDQEDGWKEALWVFSLWHYNCCQKRLFSVAT